MTEINNNDELIETLQLPSIELEIFFNKENNLELYQIECKKVAEAFHKYGVCIVKDPRVNESNNSTFLNMMEQYFEQSDGIDDARPDLSYQVGVTPERTEKPRDYCSKIGSIGPDDKPLSPCPPELDPKWRFFWRVGEPPKSTKFKQLNAEPVIPKNFPQWTEVMNMWGNKMLDALLTIAEMAAVGFNIPKDSFTSLMADGPHLLAPTGSDFNKYGQLNTVLAGYHTDLNFLTIHGKSRFPGLRLWTREGKKVNVAVPDGCLLVQAGKQIEYLTGGYILAGFHEVIVSESTVKVIQQRKANNQSLWRVSSTCFGHIQSDQLLQPLPPFDTPEAKEKFPPKFTGDLVSTYISN